MVVSFYIYIDELCMAREMCFPFQSWSIPTNTTREAAKASIYGCFGESNWLLKWGEMHPICSTYGVLPT